MGKLLNSLKHRSLGVESVVAIVVSCCVIATLFAFRHTPQLPSSWVWAVAIGLGVFAAECVPVHILYRREATSFSLFEVPLAVGIILLPGWQLQLAVFVGLAVALVGVRRQPRIKALFNVFNLSLHTAVSILLFDLLAPDEGLGALSVVAVIGACLLGGVVASVMITLVIRASEGELDARQLGDMFVFSALVALANSSLGLMALKLGVNELWSVLLLIVPVALAGGAYRAFVRERNQREQLQFLLSANKKLHADLGQYGSIADLVSETAAMFRSSRVELVIFDDADAVESSVRCRLQGAEVTSDNIGSQEAAELRKLALLVDRPQLATPTASGDPVDEWLLSLGLTDCLVAPVVAENNRIGLFVVAERSGKAAGFGPADVELFSTLSLNVGAALENNRLGQALTQLKELEQELSHLAVHDLLTGLPNRIGLRNFLDSAHVSPSVDLLFIDLDDFKIVNDTLGHSVGDKLLVEVGSRLRDCLSADHFAARLGGDEFAVCAPSGAGRKVADCIVESIAQAWHFDDTPITIGCSIGIAQGVATPDTATLLRQADVAMYAAKSSGKNRVQVYTSGLGDEVVQREHLIRQLRSAVGAGELRVHYQTIHDVRDGNVLAVGAEALVRWASDDGIQNAAEFLTIAEEIGLVNDIDRWVYRRVMNDAKSLDDLEWISVNVSARHLEEDDVVQWLLATTEAAGVDPSRILLEITETATMVNITSSTAKLTELRAHGFGIALDDFGTGHSSIAYLRTLPFTVLKMAHQFIVDLDGTSDPTFVKAIIDLAHTLDLPVVAEGIETPQQLEQIATLGCDLAQGYHLSQPGSVETVLETLASETDSTTATARPPSLASIIPTEP